MTDITFFDVLCRGIAKHEVLDQLNKITDFEEAFSEDLHTTGFSHPLISACNGEAICDHVEEHLVQSHGDPLLKDLWYYMADGPLEYASKGIVNKVKEEYLIEGLRLAVARAYSYALIDELAWFAAHASHHAWQVNYLFEAAMFGSILDDGGLKGRLDRVEYLLLHAFSATTSCWARQ